MDMRLALGVLLLCVTAAHAADDQAATTGQAAAPAHSWALNELRLYAYEIKQTVSWQSADDDLTYVTTIRMECTLKAEELPAETGGPLRLRLLIIGIDASHTGPGSAAELNTATGAGLDDPLLGDLSALAALPLWLVVDPASGVVQDIVGLPALYARLDERHPSRNPAVPNRMAGPAKAAFSKEALIRQWSGVLAVPGRAEPAVEIPGVEGAQVERRWEGNAYALRLVDTEAASGDKPTMELHKHPTPVALSLTELQGNGSADYISGVLNLATGTMTYQLNGLALTQAVRQQHQLQWQFVLSQIVPGDGAGDAAEGASTPAASGEDDG